MKITGSSEIYDTVYHNERYETVYHNESYLLLFGERKTQCFETSYK